MRTNERPFPQWWDVLWIPVFVCALAWFFGSVANWLNGYGFGLT